MSEHKRFEVDPTHQDETAKVKAQMGGGTKKAVEIPMKRVDQFAEGTNPTIDLNKIKDQNRLGYAEGSYRKAMAEMRRDKDEENIVDSIRDIQRLSDARAPYQKAMAEMRRDKDEENIVDSIRDIQRLSDARAPYQKVMAEMRQGKDAEDELEAKKLAAVQAGNQEFFKGAKAKRDAIKAAVKDIDKTLDNLLK